MLVRWSRNAGQQDQCGPGANGQVMFSLKRDVVAQQSGESVSKQHFGIFGRFFDLNQRDKPVTLSCAPYFSQLKYGFTTDVTHFSPGGSLALPEVAA